MAILRHAGKYLAITRINLLNNLAYVGDMASRSLFMVIIMYVFVQLWTATYATIQPVGGAIADFRLEDTIWYLVITETLMLGKARVVDPIAEQVKDGSVAYVLNKPYDYVLYHFFSSLGETLLKAAFVFGVGVIWVSVLVAPPNLHPASLLALLISGALALVLDFVISAGIGLLAFFTEDVSAFAWIYQKVVFILGGMMIPLDFLPDWLRHIAASLPFAYTTYAPARLFVKYSSAELLAVVLWQAGWIGALGLVVWLVYRYGLRQVAINGG
jgi:ABC-2 type transport system permease protein